MPRIRSLKPDFFLDEDLAELPLWVRVIYEGLWCHADKEGRLEDRPQKLKAVIYPYDKYDVEDGLKRLSLPKIHSPKHKPFIIRYEIKGERYIQILAWNNHQSPHHTERDSDIPAYTGEIPVKDTLDKGSVGDVHEQGPMNLSHESYQKEFEGFWESYPEKKQKQDALKAFMVLRRSVHLEEIARAFNGYMDFLKAKRVKENFEQRPMYPATFLRNERWRDYIDFKYSAKL
jgi:hypothetical protein